MLDRSLPLFLVALALAIFTSQSALAHEGTHEGKVMKAGGSKLTVKGADKKGADHEHTVDVAKDAKITLDDKAAKLEDLKEGFHVTVTTDAKHLATKIVAHSKDK
jgi:hypothetical protein